MTPEKKLEYNRKAKERMRELRKKNTSSIKPVLTRGEKFQQRKSWRETKVKQFKKMSPKDSQI